ncbi:unnamed protein product [Psylliodes chrysocephalus]|uniref:Uncharacterized protein n=1 Tax=Psylliodes chrysocephalus TaxID=3402493 RepID=A0A9P0DE83_9CUCU|nr:unnamed protein product [Psylliodes chrysocephala]
MEATVTEKVLSFIKEETSTPLPTVQDVADSDSKQLTTVIIFVISAILAITLLFVIAIFIDCRQQKLQKLQSKPKRRLLRLKLPIPIIGRPVREDQNSILDKIEYGEPSSSQA